MSAHPYKQPRVVLNFMDIHRIILAVGRCTLLLCELALHEGAERMTMHMPCMAHNLTPAAWE